MKNSLCLTWNILIGLFVLISDSEAARATTLILGKSKPELKTDMLPTGEENISTPAVTSVLNETSNVANVTKLTGIPQIDYIYDPNLPRELNGFNLTDYPFYNAIPEDIDFKCDGLHDGFYASVPHKCQVYHHCLFGTRYDFLCANYTAFDQKTFICHFASEVDCKNSPKYFSRNEALYKAATTTTNAPLTPLKRRPQSEHSGTKRKRPYRVRKPAYEYYDDAEDEYEDFPERDYYYEDEPAGSRRRKRPRPHTRDSFHESEEQDEDDDEGQEEETERKNKPGGSKSSYDRPRAPLKGKRRPTHVNERDHQDYGTGSRATKPKEYDTENRRQNEGGDDVKGKKGSHRSEYENSREEDRRSSEAKGGSRKDGNVHRERIRQEDRVLKGGGRKPVRKRTRPDGRDYSDGGGDYVKDRKEHVEDDIEDDGGDYYDYEDSRTYKNHNHHDRPKYNPGKIDHDERPSRIQQKTKNEENGGRWRDDDHNYRTRQEPPGDKTSDKRRESEHKKTSKNKDPDFRVDQTSVKNEDNERSSSFETERDNARDRGESNKNLHRNKNDDYFYSGSEENVGRRHQAGLENIYKSKPEISKEKVNEKNRAREPTIRTDGINIASRDYRDQVGDEKYLSSRKPLSGNKEREGGGGRPHSNRPGSFTRVPLKRKQVDHVEGMRTNSKEKDDDDDDDDDDEEEDEVGKQFLMSQEKVKSDDVSATKLKSTNNMSVVNGRYAVAGPQRSHVDSFKSSKEIEEYKDYDEPVPAPRPAYITDISESTSDGATRKRPVEDKVNPFTTKRNHPYKKAPIGSSNEKILASGEEQPGKERETDYDEDEDKEAERSEKETDRRESSEVGERDNAQEKGIRLPSNSESIKSGSTRPNQENHQNEHQEKQSPSHRLKVPLENSENTEELAPRAPINPQAIISARRRPFLPSRGGNPSLPRGLSSVGTRSLLKSPDKYESGTESATADKYNPNARLRIPEKKPIEFRTKVTASIGVEQPRLTSYYFDESPFENDHHTHMAPSNNDRSIYFVQTQKKAETGNDDYSSPTASDVTKPEADKIIDFSYGYGREPAEADKARQRSGIGSAPIKTGASTSGENLKTDMKNLISSQRPKIQSAESGNFPTSVISQLSQDSVIDGYSEEKNEQNPRKQLFSSGPLSFYTVPAPSKISSHLSEGQTRLGPQVFHSENPKFKTTLVVPDHLVPKSPFSQPLKYSTNSPTRLPNRPHTSNQNAPRQTVASTIALDFYDDSSNGSGDSEEADSGPTLNDALQRPSVLQSHQVPSRLHHQLNRRHHQVFMQNKQKNFHSSADVLHTSPTSLRHAIPLIPFHQITPNFSKN